MGKKKVMKARLVGPLEQPGASNCSLQEPGASRCFCTQCCMKGVPDFWLVLPLYLIPNPWLQTENMRQPPAGLPAGWNTTDRSCRLLGIPPELILIIKSFLPYSSRLALSITCKELCVTSDEDFVSRDSFPFLLARDIPDGVPCGPCNKVHRPTGLINHSCSEDRKYSFSNSQRQRGTPLAKYQLTRLLAKTIAQGRSGQERIQPILDRFNYVSRETNRARWPLLGLQPTLHITTESDFKLVEGRLLSKSESVLLPLSFSSEWLTWIRFGMGIEEIDDQDFWLWNHTSIAVQTETYIHEAIEFSDFLRRLSWKPGVGSYYGLVAPNNPQIFPRLVQHQGVVLTGPTDPGAAFCLNIIELPSVQYGIVLTTWKDHGGFGTAAVQWWKNKRTAPSQYPRPKKVPNGHYMDGRSMAAVRAERSVHERFEFETVGPKPVGEGRLYSYKPSVCVESIMRESPYGYTKPTSQGSDLSITPGQVEWLDSNISPRLPSVSSSDDQLRQAEP